MPSDPHVPRRPDRSHRAGGGRSSLSLRLAMLVGVTAILAGSGIAVASGMVQTPLSDSQQAPEAATLAPAVNMAQPSANANSYALATLPASMRPHATASATKSATPKPTTHPTSSATPSTAQSSSAASNLLTPQPTAEYETPTGQNELAWSEAILTGLGDPLTSANITSIGYWMQNEAGSPPSGIVGANNPINVSEPGYGGTQIQYEAPGYYLMSYPTVQEGVAAIAAYLNSGSYPQILSDLQQGVGLMSDSSLASELLEYSGSGYSTIPDSWGSSQGTPPS